MHSPLPPVLASVMGYDDDQGMDKGQRVEQHNIWVGRSKGLNKDQDDIKQRQIR